MKKNTVSLTCISVITLLLMCSCPKPDYNCVLNGICQSQVLYAKNTLEYPVLVQCFYRQFSTSPDILWCEQDPIEWSAPILLNIGETKIIMDYVAPVHIKIFRASDTALMLDLPNLDIFPLDSYSDNAVTYSWEEVKNIGKKLESKNICVEGFYYLKNERYELNKVPWNIYPIWFDQFDCTKTLLDELELRKSYYENQANGYARVSCIIFNKDAACF